MILTWKQLQESGFTFDLLEVTDPENWLWKRVGYIYIPHERPVKWK